MSNITASLVKDLRERSGAGMMDCKKALTETNGDFDAAIDWLRTKGLAAAAKKAGRVASEGLVACVIEGKVGAAIELNSETDFVARNDIFQNLVSNIANAALKASNVDELKAVQLENGKNVEEEVTSNVATIGENLSLRRAERLSVDNGQVISYIHNSVAPSMGKIAVLVALETQGTGDKIAEVGKQIAMHIAAARPISLDIASVDPAIVDKEKAIFIEQAKESGKPDNIIEKMVEGRVRKFYEESVLLEQAFVMDNKVKIKEVIANLAKELGKDVSLKAFTRFELGEGIEQEETDFAAEVAAVTGN